jgi:hypothetical protein
MAQWIPLRRTVVVGLAVLALAAAGCSSTGGAGRSGGSGGGRGGIEEIHLFGYPNAMNLDSRPGPDGFGIRFYLTQNGKARGVEMRQGRIDVLMFDGAVPEAEIPASQPLKVWSFTPQQLAPVAGTSALGMGYLLTLNWGTTRPRMTGITVVVRYHPPSGPDLYSAPNAIVVGK